MSTYTIAAETDSTDDTGLVFQLARQFDDLGRARCAARRAADLFSAIGRPRRWVQVVVYDAAEARTVFVARVRWRKAVRA